MHGQQHVCMAGGMSSRSAEDGCSRVSVDGVRPPLCAMARCMRPILAVQPSFLKLHSVG